MYQRSETEIMEHWEGDKSTPLVSICTITYNHELFIEKALDSFLMQETNFPFEIVIDDDCSTDNNAKIIQTYIDKYPTIINANLRKVNVGIAINSSENNERAKGKYIALCEGDDYWINKNKLQFQCDILEENEDVDLCFHKATKLDMRNQEKSTIGMYLDHDGIVSLDDILLKIQGQIPTASLFFRKNIVQEIETFIIEKSRYTVRDILIQFFASKRGGVYFINRTMSLYRHYALGSWSSMQRNHSYKEKIIGVASRIEAYEEIDRFTHKQYTKALKKTNKKSALIIIKEPGIPYLTRIFFILDHRQYFTIKEQLVYLIAALIPIDSYIPDNVYQYLKKLFRMPSTKT